MLVSSVIGSLISFKLGITMNDRWSVPFWGILLTGISLYLFYPAIFAYAMQFNIASRIAIAAVLIFPIGYFSWNVLSVGYSNYKGKDKPLWSHCLGMGYEWPFYRHRWDSQRLAVYILWIQHHIDCCTVNLPNCIYSVYEFERHGDPGFCITRKLCEIGLI